MREDVGQTFETIEVPDAGVAEALFRKSFNDPAPKFPRHFILRAKGRDNSDLVIGYVHFTKRKNFYLGGGMCVDSRCLRQLSACDRRNLAGAGGAAFVLLSSSLEMLDDCCAAFGYVGNRLAYRIDLAVGFETTPYEHLIVYWKKKNMDHAEKNLIIDEASRIGPF